MAASTRLNSFTRAADGALTASGVFYADIGNGEVQVTAEQLLAYVAENGGGGPLIVNNPPTANVGIDGQVAFYPAAGLLYGPKSGGVWPDGILLNAAALTPATQALIDASVSSAQAAATTAQTASAATLVSAAAKGTYSSVTAGLAATTTGQYFYVAPSSNDPSAAADLYLNNSGVGAYTNSTLAYTPLAVESGYAGVWVDPVSSRIAMAIRLNGNVVFYSVELPAGCIGRDELSSTITSVLPGDLAAETGFALVEIDPVSGRMSRYVTQEGDQYIPGLVIGSGAVSLDGLSADVQRQALPQASDVIEVPPDLIRGVQGTVGTRTQQDGTAWQGFPETPTQNLRGVNTSGASIDFRRSSRLPIRGVRYMGTFDPGPLASVQNDNHMYVGATAIAAASIYPANSYIDYWNTSQNASYNGVTVRLGDLIVSVGVGEPYQIQASPGSTVTRLEGDWWLVSAAGTFKGIAVAPGDRLVFLGYDGRGGLGKNTMFYLANAANGELYYRGEFDASAGAMPASPVQGDLWSVSVAGTVGGVSYAANDYALYDSGVWGRIPTDTITTVAAGAMIPALKCNRSASEYEVRRTDKSATRVGVVASVRHQSNLRRNTDVVMLRSDSMFGVPNVQPQLQTLLPNRTTILSTKGGSTSREVLASMEQEIYQGDPYRGALNFLWHGQNNQPSTVGDANWSQILDAALRYVELIGSRDRRFCFLSVLGQNNMSWNGTRIVVSQHEAQFGKTGPLYALEQWYAAMFPGQWLSPRQILLAAAAGSTLQDMRAPGMTEAQTAAAYGWIPYSYWLSAPSASVISSLNHKGFYSASGLPSGGDPNDAYIRTGGGTVGNTLANIDGVWTEYTPDITHLGPSAGQGGQYIAQALYNYLITNYL